jgi:hypothetical protein
MSIVDTKPFMLPVIRHSIFVHRPRVTGIQAVAAGAAGCHKSLSNYTLTLSDYYFALSNSTKKPLPFIEGYNILIVVDKR